MGASEAITLIEATARASECVATVGQITVQPGGVNVIPGRADFSLDLRAATDAERDAMWEELDSKIAALCAARGLGYAVTETHRAPAMVCAPWLRACIVEGIAAAGDTEPMELWSRAGHDGMVMGTVTDVAMLFLLCFDGISHHPGEDVREIDVERGLVAFKAAVLAVAERS
ncbi:hypothetical protein AWW71_29570 [Bacillus cereus]|uniref:M20/M25/M40 family metallo-hydrolase n=1 Tax=Bacillus cereus TaxID=1396 RepID=UPI00076265C0|nr:M20/M25/M40 family metallo-hydrolase [Bacillus cereus]KWU66421.1 hypothetical protein AWW71_29570 [Bacillus cereus]